MKKGTRRPRAGTKAADASQNATLVSQNVTKIALTTQQIAAAALVADDAQTDEQIAASVGVDRRTLARWKRDEEFIAEVRRLIEEYEKQILHVGIAQRRKRLDALNDRWHRMARVIEARATAPEMQIPAGGDTGLLVRDIKGAAGEIVEVFAVDTALLKEMRETEKQAAQEIGHWVERFTAEITDDELLRQVREMFGIPAAPPPEQPQEKAEEGKPN